VEGQVGGPLYGIICSCGAKAAGRDCAWAEMGWFHSAPQIDALNAKAIGSPRETMCGTPPKRVARKATTAVRYRHYETNRNGSMGKISIKFET